MSREKEKKLMKNSKALGYLLICLNEIVKRRNLLVVKFNTEVSEKVFSKLKKICSHYELDYVRRFLYINRMLFVDVLSSLENYNLSAEQLGVLCQKKNRFFTKHNIRKDDMRFWGSDFRTAWLKKIMNRGVTVPKELMSLPSSLHDDEDIKEATSPSRTTSLSESRSYSDIDIDNENLDVGIKIDSYPGIDVGTQTDSVLSMNAATPAIPDVGINIWIQAGHGSSDCCQQSGNPPNIRMRLNVQPKNTNSEVKVEK